MMSNFIQDANNYNKIIIKIYTRIEFGSKRDYQKILPNTSRNQYLRSILKQKWKKWPNNIENSM